MLARDKLSEEPRGHTTMRFNQARSFIEYVSLGDLLICV
jgi:hypothetical protein